jgi:hypothetical protein
MIKWIAIGTVAVFAICVYSMHEDEQRWQVYSAAHHCKLVAIVGANSASGMAGGNALVIVTPERKTYVCDDGMSVTR